MTSHIERWNRAWAANWPGALPIAHRLSSAFPDRWGRFHSLPGSKRYADSEDEYQIILDRHHSVLDEIASDLPELLLITCAEADHPRPRRNSRIAQASPPARRWQTVGDDLSEPGCTSFFSVFVSRISRSREALDPVLRLVADDIAHDVMLAPADFRWLPPVRRRSGRPDDDQHGTGCAEGAPPRVALPAPERSVSLFSTHDRGCASPARAGSRG